MENIYKDSIQAVENGAKFNVDFHKRSLKLNGKTIIQQGLDEGNLGMKLDTEMDFLNNVEEMYSCYKHSVPSERSESKSKVYFRALRT